MLLLLACTSPTAPIYAEAPEADAQPYAPPDELPKTEIGQPLLLNEAMSDNESTVMDPAGAFPDWIELYAVETVDLTGWTLSDDDVDAALPAQTLQAGERLLLWADGTTTAGHLPFHLGAGDTLSLRNPTGDEVDGWTQPALAADVAWGRFPDGGSMHRATILATPGLPNPRDPGMETDPSVVLFPEDEVLRLDLVLPEASLTGLRADASTYVQGGISFEGVYLSPVGVRLKGQAGSARSIDQKCAFHIGMDAFEAGLRLRTLEHVVLNNMVQDPSFVHERLTYALFRAFDVPAPRVAHVNVYINGALRGLYLNVESPDETFLATWFGSPDGNLYEGAYGPDIGSYDQMELDRDGEDVAPYTELAALAALLAQPADESRVAELEAMVDVERAINMWAVEVVTGHWDGYFYYPNNYRIYHDPSTNRLTLLPWGTDQTWGWTGDPHGAAGDIAAWALQIPSIRERFDLALWQVSEAVVSLGLSEDARSTWKRIAADVEADPYKEYDVSTAEQYVRSTQDYLTYNPDYVLGTIFPDGVP